MNREFRDDVSAPVATIDYACGSMKAKPLCCKVGCITCGLRGKLLFPIFRDGTGTIQGIVPKAAVPEELFNYAEGADAGDRACG